MASKKDSTTWLLIALAAVAAYFLFIKKSAVPAPGAPAPLPPGGGLLPVSQSSVLNPPQVTAPTQQNPTAGVLPDTALPPTAPFLTGLTPSEVAYLQTHQGIV